MRPLRVSTFACLSCLVAFSAFQTAARGEDTVFFSTNDPDGKMAAATRPDKGGQIEIEAADDFILDSETLISHATFTGLIPANAELEHIDQVVVEIYRVFPKDSDANRTPKVPTRTNSPSDVAFDSRDSSANTLTFTTTSLGVFAAANSVLNGIHPSPNQTTGGDGPVVGQEVEFTVTFATPFDLPADHYFFVPQVHLEGGQFYWLSAPKPIVAPGTPFTPDLQAWIRNADLDPDWLRIGTDIVGGTTPPTFNMAFSLTGGPPQPAGGGGGGGGGNNGGGGGNNGGGGGNTGGLCGTGIATMSSLTLAGLLLMRLMGTARVRNPRRRD